MRNNEEIWGPDITRYQDNEIWLVHKYTNTKEKKYTNAKVHNYTSTQVHMYTSSQIRNKLSWQANK